MFPTNYIDIVNRIDSIHPVSYSKTRNYLTGAVTQLSPYISRGVITPKQIFFKLLSKGFTRLELETFVKELAWREYYQRVWKSVGDKINQDLKQNQDRILNRQIPESILSGKTQIAAIDNGIQNLYSSGYLHNHLRMYIASICCNIAGCHWKLPAQWMYYYLLDADWASNTLSWQWVAGSFSSKKYYANQENINKYCTTQDQNTFLDIPYADFENIQVPGELKEVLNPVFKTELPQTDSFIIDFNLPSYIYNFYNLDMLWEVNIPANRILLLEPSFFTKYPVATHTIDFILALAKNIPNIRIFVGEFGELFPQNYVQPINYKEHPTNSNYLGIEHPREWLFEEVQGYYPSFFNYWKKCEKYFLQLTQI